MMNNWIFTIYDSLQETEGREEDGRIYCNIVELSHLKPCKPLIVFSSTSWERCQALNCDILRYQINANLISFFSELQL